MIIIWQFPYKPSEREQWMGHNTRIRMGAIVVKLYMYMHGMTVCNNLWNNGECNGRDRVQANPGC
jgi:hypothetical protein